MRYLLDTNTWIDYLKRDERVARIERTLAPFRSLPFDGAAARRYAEIRDALESRGEAQDGVAGRARPTKIHKL